MRPRSCWSICPGPSRLLIVHHAGGAIPTGRFISVVEFGGGPSRWPGRDAVPGIAASCWSGRDAGPGIAAMGGVTGVKVVQFGARDHSRSAGATVRGGADTKPRGIRPKMKPSDSQRHLSFRSQRHFSFDKGIQFPPYGGPAHDPRPNLELFLGYIRGRERRWAKPLYKRPWCTPARRRL